MDNKVTSTICNYFKTQPVQKAWMFGSFSRNEEKASSDVDLIVTLVPGTKMGLKYFGMIVDLEHLLNRPVDMVLDGDLLPFSVDSVNRDKILIYERDC